MDAQPERELRKNRLNKKRKRIGKKGIRERND